MNWYPLWTMWSVLDFSSHSMYIIKAESRRRRWFQPHGSTKAPQSNLKNLAWMELKGYITQTNKNPSWEGWLHNIFLSVSAAVYTAKVPSIQISKWIFPFWKYVWLLDVVTQQAQISHTVPCPHARMQAWQAHPEMSTARNKNYDMNLLYSYMVQSLPKHSPESCWVDHLWNLPRHCH